MLTFKNLNKLVLSIGLFFPVCQAVQAQNAANIIVPTEAILAQFPKMSGFRLSPDGKHLLAIESQGDVRNILIWKIEELSRPPKVIGSANMQIRTASFIKNNLLVVDLFQPFDSRMGELTKTFISKTLFYAVNV